MSQPMVAGTIRVRVGVAVVEGDRILLVPHFDTDHGPVQWCLPGGRLAFGETLRDGARREFREETGLEVEVGEVLDVSEVLQPERPWHSITIAFLGKVVGGAVTPEPGHPYGEKVPRWLTAAELARVPHHPQTAVRRALGIHGAGVDA